MDSINRLETMMYTVITECASTKKKIRAKLQDVRRSMVCLNIWLLLCLIAQPALLVIAFKHIQVNDDTCGIIPLGMLTMLGIVGVSFEEASTARSLKAFEKALRSCGFQ